MLIITMLLLVVIALVLFLAFLTTKYSAPFWRRIDQSIVEGNPEWKGFSPAVHTGTPWGFTHEELNKIDLTGKVCVVTGANVGLGYGVAYLLASRNATVILGCRSKAKGKEAIEKIKSELGLDDQTAANILECVELDLSLFQSVREFAEYVTAKYPVINSLILNAGLGLLPFEKSKEGLEVTISVNHMGHFLLTDLLLPCLENAKVSTIVSVSSMGHYHSYPQGILSSIEEMNDESNYRVTLAYGQSKLANVLFAQELAERYKDKGILANSLHPGMVTSEFGRYSEVSYFAKHFGATLGKWIVQFLLSLGWDPKDAALTVLYLAFSPKVLDQKVTGKYFHPIARETEVAAHAKDKKLQKRLWDLSEEFINKH